MKLLQLNTWSCKLSPEIVKLLDNEDPDFITFQEAVGMKFSGKVLETSDDILEKHPFTSGYYAPLVRFDFMHRKAGWGNLIASQLPITHENSIWTHGQYTDDFDYIELGGFNTSRNIAHITVESNGQPLHILTLHGYHVKEHKNGNEETLSGCRQLVEYATSLEGAVIIAGDFNLVPESESIQVVTNSFRNLSLEYGLTTTRNYLTTKSDVCDYIFVNDKVTVNDFSMSDAIVSDHNALVLDFDLF